MPASDLVLGVIVLALLSGTCFVCGFTLGRRQRFWVSATLLSLASAIALGARLYGHLHVARLLPFSNVIVVGNWLPAAAAMLMGSIAAVPQIPVWRRTYLAGMLGTLAWYPVLFDLLAPAPSAGPPLFSQGFCLQSTPASCSACCAATLLRDHQIQASEGEMMKLCLTRLDGTPELGLYRGLKLKTQDTPWDVATVSGSVESLRQPGRLPVIAFVRLDDDIEITGGGRSEKLYRWWWLPRQSHAVFIYGFHEDDGAEVGDPSSGSRRWTVDELRSRWCGVGLRLVRRE